MSAIVRLKIEQQKTDKEDPLETLSRSRLRMQLGEVALQPVEEFTFESPFPDFTMGDECAAVARSFSSTKSKLHSATTSSRAKTLEKAMSKKYTAQKSLHSSREREAKTKMSQLNTKGQQLVVSTKKLSIPTASLKNKVSQLQGAVSRTKHTSSLFQSIE